MSNQRCEACYHTPLPCMGGHVGRMAEAPPETGHPATMKRNIEAAEAELEEYGRPEGEWLATGIRALKVELATLRADVARLTEQVREWRAEAEAAGDRARAEEALRREVEAERDTARVQIWTV